MAALSAVFGAFAAFAAFSVVAGVAGVVGSAGYAVADPVAAPAPGSLISYGKIDDPSFAINGAGAVYALSYYSRGAGQELVPVRATAWIPTSPAPAGGYPVASWAHGTRGLGDSCAVSTSVFVPGGPDYAATLEPWPLNGFVLVATEYAGIGGPGVHPYLVGDVSGANVIDAVRATRELGERAGIGVSDRYTTAGGSQGGHASLSAGTMAATYAPELTLLGTTAIAPPMYVDRYLSLLGPAFPPVPVPDYVTYLAYVLRGLQAADPSVDVDSYLTPTGKRILKDAETACYQQMVQETQEVGVGDLLARPLGRGTLMDSVREHQVVPATGFSAPVLIHQGVFDVTAFGPLTDRYVADARAAGADIDYRQGAYGHDAGRETMVASAEWARSRWAADNY